MSEKSRAVEADLVYVRVFLDGVLFNHWAAITVDEDPGSSTCRLQIPWTPLYRRRQWEGASLTIWFGTDRVRKLFGEDPALAMAFVNQYTNDFARAVVSRMWETGDEIWVRYVTGF